jgi:RecA-family ATPase
MVEPDIQQLNAFIDVMWRHAPPKGYASSRAFMEKSRRASRITAVPLKDGLDTLKQVAAADARKAAREQTPIVFCPPLVAFKDGMGAKEANVEFGVALTVDCDKGNPAEGIALLSQHLGSATVEVLSGGTCVDEHGQTHDRLHGHWRLRVPATGADLKKLTELRSLACALISGDPSMISNVHCVRWPGSVHRKGEPKLCITKALRPEREIDLDTALNALRAAAKAKGRLNGGGRHENGHEEHLSAPPDEVAAALRVIPNNYDDRADWVRIGMAAYSASAGAPEVWDAFDEFSQKWPGYDAEHTRKTWDSFEASPPTSIGAGTIFRLAREADPEWFEKYEEARQARPFAELEELKAEAPAPEERLGHPQQGESKVEEPKPEPPSPPPKLPFFVDTSKWDDEPAPPQEWAVENRIPLRQVALFSGEGGAGKSTTLLQCCFAHALARLWLASSPTPGPGIFIDAEDDVNVLRRRGGACLMHYGSTWAEARAGGLALMSLIGQDPVLGAFSQHKGRILPTSLFDRVLEAAGDIKPKMIGIASTANVFAGSENDRSQVQQFVDLLGRIAQQANGAVVLVSHPSLAGINTDTGLSGTTQWHNAVRARFYMKMVKPEGGELPDNNLRQIVFRKNQYAEMPDDILLRYQYGLFLPVEGVTSVERAAKVIMAKDMFMELLKRFLGENRRLSGNPATHSSSYAPKVFALEAKAKAAALARRDFEDAMRELFAEARIWNEPCGPASRRHYYLAPKG